MGRTQKKRQAFGALRVEGVLGSVKEFKKKKTWLFWRLTKRPFGNYGFTIFLFFSVDFLFFALLFKTFWGLCCSSLT